LRNLVEFPVTKDEIVRCLLDLAYNRIKENVTEVLVGDMTPLLRTTAAQIISELDETQLKHSGNI